MDRSKSLVGIVVLAIVAVYLTVFVCTAEVADLQSSSSAAGSVAACNGVSLADWCVIAIAVVAVAVSITEASVARRHARLSVRPSLNIASDVSKGLIELENAGLGPAVITRMQVGTSELPLQDASAETWDLVIDLLDLGAVDRTWLPPRTIIASSSRVVLLSIGEWTTSKGEAVASRLRISVSYESLYGESWDAKYGAE